jgi:transcriptional regulator with XRE-family HTH domain
MRDTVYGMKQSADLPMTSPAALGRSLRALRRRRGLSQAQVAEQLGLQRSYLSQIENGEVNEQVKRIVELVRLLGGDLSIRDREAE